MDTSHARLADGDVREALASFVARAGHGNVEVAFAAGTATLHGAVDSSRARRALEDLVLAHDGVERVVNGLEVAPAGVAGHIPR